MSGADPRVRAVLKLAPVIPVFTPDDVDDAVQVAQALFRGGLPVIEVTLRTPRAMDAIRAMVEAVPDAVVGAGTVLTPSQMEAARAAGARFAVSPGATPTLYAAARDADLPYLPGVATGSELILGLEHGLDTFKFFPAVQAGGAALLAAWHGPFADVRFCPTGGISAQTAAQFLHLPNVLCVGGSWLTTAALLQTRDWGAIERLAREASVLAG
ncbi:TPA: bifunctional 4-hydroxy-2-oxoglutarate aldolase/2-dehydro-3-deoxy-phosphogluconate aldolase [Stenotrophomonas maltophilia]|jgi:2-dehydro-3-deoxyphosphogluconate aldolase/(4S)-4-hydroxy-2-oxoglutarate aldolase|uniref:bifunctional 4-hydroxy-2-oxoglutarate aldolase/2-dehydro-3-deoxy-phosphogluconate aldolase n=1 Tax=Stenotrophomonas TaxID=40323 RepID=UPI0013100475|nr:MULTISPECIES: bifunctional 4-hydroxy-2-oxoglutarate aldolase/2-dehydro-3-deoxy-phosphogluconate aldolase [Stenotrophomonas]MBE5269115.1 bifunctional 4-hydroxy-2-oxoglutarate aldolase/2-dehydro-3-deoxy-phosphogluconate aldolase [Stenotrophomonas sp. B2]MDH2022088.1 bifunctional 4-hydroxy-2-oxoglutarate aldolase/2-dehydro-3-deoxy-phosphogluconate aldolase [Stenotrophomonas sp. GD03680]HEL3749907.1 bifunctional 4-hydroxy-2-oxoglutarate aldolase/2-dehydro-3-deoxy-phosphogluconate aldolase [Stenot